MQSKLSTISSFLKRLKSFFRKLFKFFLKYEKLSEVVELTILYFLAIVSLTLCTQNLLGVCPKAVYQIFPFARQILSFGPFKFLAYPEKTIALYLIGIDMIFNREICSLLFKYNVLLVFVLEMLQNLVTCYYDIFIHRDLDYLIGVSFFSSPTAALNFFSNVYYIFVGLYLYCYVLSLFGKFPTFKGPFKRITDSIAFWLHIGEKKDYQK